MQNRYYSPIEASDRLCYALCCLPGYAHRIFFYGGPTLHHAFSLSRRLIILFDRHFVTVITLFSCRRPVY